MVGINSKKLVALNIILFVILGSITVVSAQNEPVVTIDGEQDLVICEDYDYTITVENVSALEPILGVAVTIDVPSGLYISDTGDGTQDGQSITWIVGELGTLPENNTASTTITLYTTCSASSEPLYVTTDYAGGQTVSTYNLSILEGDVVASFDQSSKEAELGEVVSFDLIIYSTGFGPISNVEATVTLGAGLSYDSSTPSGAVSGQTITWDQISFPALALIDEDTFKTITLSVVVDSCENTDIYAEVSWGCPTDGEPCGSANALASVVPRPNPPVITYVLPTFELDYCSSSNAFDIVIGKTGGIAETFELDVDFGSNYSISVTNPFGAYYDAINKKFVFPDGLAEPSTTLSFIIDSSNWCSASQSGSLIFEPHYTYSLCEFNSPVQFSSYSVANVPTLSFDTATASDVELMMGDTITFNWSLSASDVACFNDGSNITIIETFPEPLYNLTITSYPTGYESVDVSGNVITWVMTPEQVRVSWTVTVEADSPLPSDALECGYCGTIVGHELVASMTDCCGCSVSASASNQVVLECEAASFTSAKTASSPSEICTPLTYTTTYVFEDSSAWDDVDWDMTFTEGMQNSQQYVTGTLAITVQNNSTTYSATVPDPPAAGPFVISMTDAVFSPSEPPVRGSTLTISYNLTTTGDSIPSCGSASFYDWSTLDINDPDAPSLICGGGYNEAVLVTIEAPSLGVSIDMPDDITECNPIQVVIDVEKTTSVSPYDALLELPITDYCYSSITYSDGFSPTEVFTNSLLTWQMDDYFDSNDTATITIQMEKRCSTQSNTLEATAYWDNLCTDDETYDRICSASTSITPYVRYQDIFAKLVPEVYVATEKTLDWTLYVLNEGSGTAHDVWLDILLNDSLSLDETSLASLTYTLDEDHSGNAINGATISLTDMSPGERINLSITTEILDCENLASDEIEIRASYFCCDGDDDTCQEPSVSIGNIFPLDEDAISNISLSGNTINLCHEQTVDVTYKNTGGAHIYDGTIHVELPEGLTYVAGSANVGGDSIDDPSIQYDVPSSGIDTLTWTKDDGDLYDLTELSDFSPNDSIIITFDVMSSCSFEGDPISTYADYTTLCNEQYSTDPTLATLQLVQPNIRISKKGRIVEDPEVTFGENVYALLDDSVEWEIIVSNNSSFDAYNVQFWESDIPSNLTGTMSIAPGSTEPSLTGSGTQPNPWVIETLPGSTSYTYVISEQSVYSCVTSRQRNRVFVTWGCNGDPDCTVDITRNDSAWLYTSPIVTVGQTLSGNTTCEGTISFNVTVSGLDALNAVVTATVPAGYDIDPSSLTTTSPLIATTPASTDPTIVWDGNDLSVGSYSFSYDIVSDGTMCDSIAPRVSEIIVDYDNSCTAESAGDDNLSVTNTKSFVPLKPVLSVEITPLVQATAPGNNSTWTITVTNGGNAIAEDMTVIADLTTFSSIIDLDGGTHTFDGHLDTPPTHQISWHPSDIAIGGSWSATITAQLCPLCDELGILDVIATSSCDGVCTSSTATKQAITYAVDGIHKAPDHIATIGEEVTYSMSLRFGTVGTYSNLVIHDLMPVSLSYVSSTCTIVPDTSTPSTILPSVASYPEITWNIGAVSSGPFSVNITVTGRVNDDVGVADGNHYVNTVSVTGNYPSGDPLDIPDATADLDIVEPNIGITKDIEETTYLPGDTIHYELELVNKGASPAYDTVIVDSIPAGLILDEESVSSLPAADSIAIVGTSATGYTITWTYEGFNSIAADGGTVLLSYEATIPDSGGFFENNVIATTTSLPGDAVGERTSGDRYETDDSEEIDPPGTALEKITLYAEGIPSPGGIVDFELTVTNTGAQELYTVILYDMLPNGFSYVPDSTEVKYSGESSFTPLDDIVLGLVIDGTSLTWPLLGPLVSQNDYVIVRFKTLVEDGVAGSFVNESVVRGASAYGIVEDTSESPVEIKTPGINIVKNPYPETTYNGGYVDYSLVVTNTGNVVLNPTVIVDTLPRGLNFAYISTPAPTSVILNLDGTTTLTWVLSSDFDVGETIIIIYKAIFNGSQSPSVNFVTVTGTPPNGDVVTDTDIATVRGVGISPMALEIVATNLVYDCRQCNLQDLFLKAEQKGILIEDVRTECCQPQDFIDELVERIAARGLDGSEKFRHAMELLDESLDYCDKAVVSLEEGNSLQAHKYASLRCRRIREGIELLLELVV